MKSLSVIISLLFCFSLSSFAQGEKKKFLKDPGDQALFDDAEYYYNGKFYAAAIRNYIKLEKDFPDEPILIFRLGVCYLHQADGIEKSLTYFKRLDLNNYERDDSYYFYGKSLHLNYQFEDAIVALERFVASKYGTRERKEEAAKIISYSKNGVELVKNKVDVAISNFGTPVNSPASEYVPLVTSDSRFIIFTYRGPQSMGGRKPPLDSNSPPEGDYYEDVFFSELTHNNTWSVPQPIPGTINTEENDACISMSGDGQKLYIFRSTPDDQGTIFISQRKGDDWGTPQILYGKINSPWWEGSITISSDGKTAYFSSERPGGYGGKDLYSAKLQPDGSWGDVKNMGPGVNSAGNEDAPFLHPSGFFLIYSSNAFNSMGGYDLFRLDMITDTSWSPPINLGYPINTPGDDIYYVITGDGKTGFYSSGKLGGQGRQDIYVVSPGYAGISFDMMQVSGVITYDDKPVDAEIRVDYTETGIPRMIQRSNSASGYYVINLPANKNFTIRYTIPGEESQVRTVSTEGMTGFKITELNISFYSLAYMRRLKEIKDSLAAVNVTDPSLVTVKTETSLIEKFGDYKLQGLVYHVQIGAYNLPENFDYRSVKKYGKVTKLVLDDGITRFIIGTTFTLKEAYVLRDKIIAAGITDAFVTAEYQGKRYLIKELAEKNFFMP